MSDLRYEVMHDDKFQYEVWRLEEAIYLLRGPKDYVVAVEDGRKRRLTEEEDRRLRELWENRLVKNG